MHCECPSRLPHASSVAPPSASVVSCPPAVRRFFPSAHTAKQTKLTMSKPLVADISRQSENGRKGTRHFLLEDKEVAAGRVTFCALVAVGCDCILHHGVTCSKWRMFRASHDIRGTLWDDALREAAANIESPPFREAETRMLHFQTLSFPDAPTRAPYLDRCVPATARNPA